MSSLFNQASLVIEPAVYETSKVYATKPFDGSGDLTFTRSNDTATRVGPDGLIEKVRTNLVLQSEAFNTTWASVNASVSANTIANPLDGAVNADTITLTGGTDIKRVQQSLVHTGNFTQSIFLKAGTHQFIQLLVGSDVSPVANFDLVNGTTSASSATSQIISLGNGWYRCSMSYSTTTATDVYLWAVDSLAAGRAAATASTGTFFAFGFQLETGDIATDYIATTSAAVSVGPVASVPRLDYLNSSCPRLLLEPQRTNSLTFSESFDNAAWIREDILSVTANAVVSPDGYTNADLVIPNTTSIDHTIYQTTSSGTARTFSTFAKAGGYNFVFLGANNGVASDGVFFNLSNGTISQNTSSFTATITSYGNGWYRCTISIASWPHNYAIICTSATGTSFVHAGNGTSGVYVWGAQFEDGAYATSYIPTLGAAVTRGVDLAQKTSASALIGQTEGTIFWEIDLRIKTADGSDDLLNLDAGSFGNTIYLYKVPDGRIAADIYVSSVAQASFILAAASVNVGIVKMALGYANNNSAFFVNGVQVGTTDTSCSVPATSRIQLGNTAVGPSFSRTAQVLLFTTRLSNAQLAELTTI